MIWKQYTDFIAILSVFIEDLYGYVLILWPCGCQYSYDYQCNARRMRDYMDKLCVLQAICACQCPEGFVLLLVTFMSLRISDGGLNLVKETIQ